MDKTRLASLLTVLCGPTLSEDLSREFLNIRRDYATRTLERMSAGKFVETFVQCLQYVATGAYDSKPDVDLYLSKYIENLVALPEGLRVCAARIARSLYTLRNKRNIAHKGEVDPNTYDLAFLHQGAAWIMAELLRTHSGKSMKEAGEMVELIQAPVGTLVEEIDGTRLVFADVSIQAELLILLHSHYPQYVALSDMGKSLKARSAGAVRNSLSKMAIQKLVFGEGKKGYRLTQKGYEQALQEIIKLQAA